jgi:hypothetical protein
LETTPLGSVAVQKARTGRELPSCVYRQSLAVGPPIVGGSPSVTTRFRLVVRVRPAD